MKKIIAFILAIVMVMALASCGNKTVHTDKDQEDYLAVRDADYVDNGNITMDTLIVQQDANGPDCPYYEVYVRDLFTTGAIGTAESSGVLSFGTVGIHADPAYTWTLKNGVCIIAGNPDSEDWWYGVNVDAASPLWNNPYIETVIVEGNVDYVGAWTWSRFCGGHGVVHTDKGDEGLLHAVSVFRSENRVPISRHDSVGGHGKHVIECPSGYVVTVWIADTIGRERLTTDF